MKVYWIIEVYDGLKLLYSEEVPFHRISERQMSENVLPLLVAKFLNYREIIYSSVNKRKGGIEKFPFLDVNIESKKILSLSKYNGKSICSCESKLEQTCY